MQKSKAKRNSFWQTQMLPFVVVWALSIFLVRQASSPFMRLFLYPFLTSTGAAVASNSIPLLVTGVVQVLLVERLLKRSMRGWMGYTTLSTLVTLFLIHIVARSYIYGQNQNVSSDLYMLINYIAFIVPAPLIQFFWLRRHIKQAWLWPVISILLMSLFSLKGFLSRDYGSGVIEATVQFLAYGIVQASLMHYLWQHPKDSEKAKIDFASDDEEARIERLQEHERRTPLWNAADEQRLQNDSI